MRGELCTSRSPRWARLPRRSQLTARSPEGAPQRSPRREFAPIQDVRLRDGGSILFYEVIQRYGSRTDERESPPAAAIAHSCVVGGLRQEGHRLEPELSRKVNNS